MNEKDPYKKEQQAPLLTPETFAPKKPETVSPIEETEHTSSKNSRGTKILLGSLAVLLVAGAITAAVLAKAGAFSKEKKETTEEMVESTSLVSETEASTTETTKAVGPHISIIALSQVTDDQIKLMDETARNLVRKDARTGEQGIPDEVDIDGMYYLGMLRQYIDYASTSSTEKDIVQMVYQVQVTDRTGEKPVKRQFFWMIGFTNVYQDGTVDPTKTEPMGSTLCFENWSAQGCLDYPKLLDTAEQAYPMKENRVDTSLIQPFEGGDEEHALVTSLDQITPAMEEGLKMGCEGWQFIGRICVGTQYDGVRIDNIEYVGLMLGLPKDKSYNCVCVVYRLDVTDLNETPPVNRSVYWYVSFRYIYEGGQIQTQVSYNQLYDSADIRDWLRALETLDRVRDCFKREQDSPGWTIEDHLEEDSTSSQSEG